MIRILLKLRAGTKICHDDKGTCSFHRYLGGQTGKREYSCALFSEMLEVDERDKHCRTKRLESCLTAESNSLHKITYGERIMGGNK